MNPIRGAGGGGKGGGGSSRVAVEDPDSLRSRQYARVLDLVSEGEIVGLVNGMKSVFLDDTPIQNPDGTLNFTGVTMETRNGTQSQSYVAGFGAVESETAVSVEVKFSAPVVRSFSNQSANAVRVTISIPMLTSQDTSNGDIHGTNVDFAIDLQTQSGGYVEKVYDTVSGKTTSQYQRTYWIEVLGLGPWDIRIRRITPDSTSTALKNQTYWSSYTVITDAKLKYPNSALVGMSMDAEKFQSIPTRGYEMKGLLIRIPSNYNPVTRVYTGIWNGTFTTAWSNNPAWCFYDLLTNARYGLGKYISDTQVDKWSLYKIGQYCDQLVSDGMGGTEPRFTCNLYIQTRDEAFKVLNTFASIFCGMPYWAAGALVATQDAPALPTALFSHANVVPTEDGIYFQYTGTSIKTRNTVALVTWNDPNDRYKQKIEYVEDAAGVAKYGIIQTEVVAVGCTSRGQAHRLGRRLIYTNLYETEVISFKVGLDGLAVAPGSIIQTSDPVRAGIRLGGRIISATTSSIVLDAPVTIASGKTYTLWVTLPDGTIANRFVSLSNTVTATIPIYPVLPVAPQNMSVWVLAVSDLVPESWRVVSVIEVDDTQAEVSAMTYRADKYDAIELGLKLEPLQISSLSVKQAAPTDIVITESLYLIAKSLIGTRITVSWNCSAAYYELQYRLLQGNWTTISTSSCSVDIQPAESGQYEFALVAMNALGLPSAKVLAAATILGKTAPPGNVGAISYSQQGVGIYLSWPEVTDLDLDCYEIRTGGTSWLTSTFVAYASGLEYLWKTQSATSYIIRIKAIDTSGNYSVDESASTIYILPPSQPVISFDISGPDELLTWTIPTSGFIVDRYELRYGTSWFLGTFVDTTKATGYRRKADYAGSRTYWLVAIDVGGNASVPTSIVANITEPSAVIGLRVDVIDNNALLYWSPPLVGTLPVDRYEARKGASWAAGTVIGSNGNSTFGTVFEQQSGVFNYWISAVDSAGNFGPAANIVATVSQPPDYVLRASISSTFSGTKVNALPSDTSLIVPVNTTQSWTDHFVSNGYATPQDQIDAGFPIYISPSPSAASYVEDIDYGSVLPATNVTVLMTTEDISGSVTAVCQIEYKTAVGDAWTSCAAGATAVLLSNFRYVRVTYTFTAATSSSLLAIRSLSIKLSIKVRSDNGAGVAAVGGTVVSFGYPFIAADTPMVQAEGSTPLIPVVIYVGGVNPTGFTVKLYNLAGTDVGGSFSWFTKGY